MYSILYAGYSEYLNKLTPSAQEHLIKELDWYNGWELDLSEIAKEVEVNESTKDNLPSELGLSDREVKQVHEQSDPLLLW